MKSSEGKVEHFIYINRKAIVTRNVPNRNGIEAAKKDLVHILYSERHLHVCPLQFLTHWKSVCPSWDYSGLNFSLRVHLSILMFIPVKFL